jgi:spore germination cell wall hydrolase CwlJ-like protein
MSIKILNYFQKTVITILVIIGLFGIDFAIKEISISDHEIIMTNIQLRELDCLTRNIHWESSGESLAGKIAVAQVTLNRVSDGRFGDDVCDVVYQKTRLAEKVVCQFSWVCQNKHKIKKIDQTAYDESLAVAKKVMFENIRLNYLHDALYFHADYVNPGWKKERIVKIGNHIFYKETEGKNNEKR